MMKFVIEASAPGTLTVAAGKKEEGKPLWVTVSGVGVGLRGAAQCIVKEGTHDCKAVVLGCQEAFKNKGAYEPRGVLEMVPWTPQEVAAYYQAKAKEYAGVK